MNYEWDQNKQVANLARHGVDFIIAEDFEWDTAVEAVDGRFDYGEERWIAFGFIHARLYILVYTQRKTVVRLISLRKANKREREFYEPA